MATSITHIEKRVPNQAEEDAQAVQELLQAVANRREDLLGLLDVLHEMQKMGMVDILRGLLQNKTEIGVIALQQINQPGMHRMIKNGMAAVQFTTRVDPEKLQILLNGLAQGVDEAVDREPGRKKGGLLGLFKTLREPAVMSSIAMMTKFLRGMGNGLKPNP